MSNISIERLEELSCILKSWLDGYDPLDDKEQFATISGAMGAISELKGLKKASTHPVGEVVAWGENIPPRQGINRKVDFRWLDVNVEPGTLLYAAPQLKPSSNPEQLAITHDMAMAFHNALSDDGIGHEDLEDIKIGLRAAFANCAPLPFQPVSNPYTLPDGWIAVPIEPTTEMLDEFDSIIDYGADDSKDAWRRLIAAAPKPKVS